MNDTKTQTPMNEIQAKVLIEAFAQVQGFDNKPCPRCGKHPAIVTSTLSRRADVNICDHCGMEEALEDVRLMDAKPMPLSDWAICKTPKKWGMAVFHV